MPTNAIRFSPFSTLLLYLLKELGSIINPELSTNSFQIEDAGCVPLLAHAAKAKVMMGNINKTDKLDAQGLATLLHLGSLPTVWLPSTRPISWMPKASPHCSI
jgi:hypothetical protein